MQGYQTRRPTDLHIYRQDNEIREEPIQNYRATEYTKNKTRTSKVGAISETQKVQNILPKNVKGGPFGIF